MVALPSRLPSVPAPPPEPSLWRAVSEALAGLILVPLVYAIVAVGLLCGLAFVVAVLVVGVVVLVPVGLVLAGLWAVPPGSPPPG